MRTTDALDQLYNPTADFLISQYPWVSSLEMGAPSAGGSTFGGGGGGGNISIVPSVEPPFYITPIITPELPITQLPKINLKLTGLKNGFIKYDNKVYYDDNTIEFNVLSSLDSVTLKGEGAKYGEYYVISFENVSIEAPVKDVIVSPPTMGGVSSGGGGRTGGYVYTGGQYNPGSPGFNSNLAERPIDQNAQK